MAMINSLLELRESLQSYTFSDEELSYGSCSSEMLFTVDEWRLLYELSRSMNSFEN